MIELIDGNANNYCNVKHVQKLKSPYCQYYHNSVWSAKIPLTIPPPLIPHRQIGYVRGNLRFINKT